MGGMTLNAIDQVCNALHGRRRNGLTWTQRLILGFILFGTVLAIISTEPEVAEDVHDVIELAELLVGGVFLAEYIARVWSIGAMPEFAGFSGRLKYIIKPFVVIDLIALLPFLLGAIGPESLVLRLIRVLRLLAISKMIRYSEAMRIVVSSVFRRRFELLFAVLLASLMILISSAALYVIEGGQQPKAFGSILRAMWWSVATLTTVGYGDVVPLTPLGKVLAGLTAIAGIGMIAMPTGILAASFSEGFARARERESQPPRATVDPARKEVANGRPQESPPN
jgi:voltage-gated potassium channel